MFVHVLLLVTGIATPFTTSIGENAFYIVRFAMGLAHNAYLMSFYMLGKPQLKLDIVVKYEFVIDSVH